MVQKKNVVKVHSLVAGLVPSTFFSTAIGLCKKAEGAMADLIHGNWTFSPVFFLCAEIRG